VDLKELQHREIPLHTRHPWELARVEIVIDLINSIPGIDHQSSPVILDIGCGDTFVAEQLVAQFLTFSFLCVDPAFTREDIAYYSNRLKNTPVQVFSSVQQAVQCTNQPVALILLLDVLEHIENDIAFLKDINKQPGITDDTFFLITVPAFQSLFSSHDVFLDHYRRYNNKQLTNHLQQAGLQVNKIGYFFSSLLPFRSLQVAKEKIFKSNTGKPTTGLVEWKHGVKYSQFLKNMLLNDFRITRSLEKLNIKLPGLSNYVICKKRA
jgi:hypothetical protein